MALIAVTDINDPFDTIYVDKAHIKRLYELDIYRIIVMEDGRQYDVSETFAYLNQEMGGNVI